MMGFRLAKSEHKPKSLSPGPGMFSVLLLFGQIHSTICLVRMQTDLEAQVLE